jgi:hypothetical protein
MNTIPSSDLVRAAVSAVAGYYAERPEELSAALDKVAERLGENMCEFRGYAKVNVVVVAEGVAVSS